jgi:hypothetical protein
VILLKLKYLALFTLAVGSAGSSFAGTMGAAHDAAHQFYIGGEGGASISLNSYFGPSAEQGNNKFTWLTPANRDFTTNFGIGGLCTLCESRYWFID